MSSAAPSTATAASSSSSSAGATLTLLHTLTGHSDRVWCCAWNPAGTALATCGGDKEIRIWATEPYTDEHGNAQTRFICKQVLEGAHSRTIRSVAWSPNGRYLASAGFDGITAVWENREGEFECISTLEGHENEVKCVSWSVSGTTLATCSRDKSVWLWSAAATADMDAAEGEFECLSVLNGHTQDVKCVKWHPKIESLLLSASYDNTIKVWREEDDDFYNSETLSAHTSTVWSITFDRTGRFLASVSDDKSMRIWKLQTKDGASPSALNASFRLQGTLTGYHTRCVYTVDWSTKNLIASGGADDAICIFDANECVASSDNKAEPTATADTGADADSAETTVTTQPALAQPPAGVRHLYTQAKAHQGDVNCVAFNPTQPHLLCSAGDDGVIKIWQIQLAEHK